MWKTEVRLAGAGGQGLGLAATVLASAAVQAGLFVTILQSYGPEARGGASRSDVTLSDCEIANPWFSRPAVLLALNQKAWTKFGGDLEDGALAVVDRDFVEVEKPGIYALRLERMAKTELREKIATNMVALGVLGVLLDRIPLSILLEAAYNKAPKGFERINRSAVELGWRVMEQMKGGVTYERPGGA